MGAFSSRPADLLKKHLETITCPKQLVATINSTMNLEKPLTKHDEQVIAMHMHSGPITVERLSKLVNLTQADGTNIRGGKENNKKVVSKDVHDYFQSAQEMSDQLLDEKEVLSMVHLNERNMTRIAGGLSEDGASLSGGGRAFNQISLFSDKAMSSNSNPGDKVSLFPDSAQNSATGSAIDQVSKFTIDSAVKQPVGNGTAASLFDNVSESVSGFTGVSNTTRGTSGKSLRTTGPAIPSKVSLFPETSTELRKSKVSLFPETSTELPKLNEEATVSSTNDLSGGVSKTASPKDVNSLLDFSQTDRDLQSLTFGQHSGRSSDDTATNREPPILNLSDLVTEQDTTQFDDAEELTHQVTDLTIESQPSLPQFNLNAPRPEPETPAVLTEQLSEGARMRHYMDQHY